MATLNFPQCVELGAQIQTPWSAHVVIKDIVVTTKVGPLTFHGVYAETLDAMPPEWTRPGCLLWIFNDGTGPRMWQHTAQPSPFNSRDLEKSFEKILGHYEFDDGDCYIAVIWNGCLAPTWEREMDIGCCGGAVTRYFTQHRI